MVVAAIKALPRSEGGFTIEVRPIAAERGSSERMRRVEADRPSRRTVVVGGTEEGPAEGEFVETKDLADSWRPKGRAVLTLAEVARVLGLGRTTIYRLIREKKMKVINVGRRTLVPLEVVDAILASGL
jgi:excisionase family DNA binding protein